MKTRYKYLEDASFLKELSKQHVKTYLVKITVLNWIEQPISSIEGRVISASINIDGQSPIRRTANLSIFIDELTNNVTNTENILSLNKKMSLEIGYVNQTGRYLDYDVLWFPLGTYIITSCSISHSDTGLVASLQLQDKMCLLNGTVSGQIPAATQFHVMYDIDDDGKQVEIYPTIYQIIFELVNHLGGEQLGKILIADLDTEIKKVMKWNLKAPLYYISKSDQYYYCLNYDQAKQKSIELWGEDSEKYIQKFQFGQDVGFIFSDFCYSGELVADAGQCITDILDQIVQFLGNFEYFYDLDGNFIFQEKKNYLNNSQTKYILEAANERKLLSQYITEQEGALNTYLINTSLGKTVFDFEDSQMIKSYSNTPQYGTIKNDYVIWGIRTDSEKREWPIRYHLAIDTKPLKTDTVYLGFEWKDSYITAAGEKKFDKHGYWVLPTIILPNNQTTVYGNATADSLPPPSFAVANRYFLDLETNKIKESYKNESGEWQWRDSDWEPVDIQAEDWRTQLLLQGAAAQALGLATNYYYTELKNEWPKIYDVQNKKFYEGVLDDPAALDYFLDFIDAGNTKINQLSISNIGRRSYVTDGGKNINCIFEKNIPDIILIKNGQEDTIEKVNDCSNRGQKYSQVPAQIYDNLTLGGVYNSAYQEIKQTLHQFTSYNETVSIQTLPLYFLQPNTRISIYNPQSNINGNYMIDSLSFALDNEGLLTINVSRALQKA